MTTTRFAQGLSSAVARTPATFPGNDSLAQGVSRREFLYYIWGASMTLLLAEAGAGIVLFLLPRFRAGEFGGVFTLTPDKLPAASPTSVPVLFSAGKFWLSNTDDGFRALSQVCTHLGCLFKWSANEAVPHYRCPCHGSQFTNKGQYIAGPAPRSLDQFVVTVTYSDGSTKVTPGGNGSPGAVPMTNAVSIAVDTGKEYTGKPHG